MKPLIFILTTLLISCGNANTNSGTRDTVVIIQPTPVPEPEEKTQPKAIPADNQTEKYSSVETTTAPNDDIDLNKNFTGNYPVVLEVFKSDCVDYTEGDSRPETWKISLTNGLYKMQVISDVRTINQYTGRQENGELILVGNHETILGIKSKATVTLHFDGEKLEGNRVLKTVDSKGEPCTLTQIVTEK